VTVPATHAHLAWIAIAPVKAMGMVELERAWVGSAGIEGDRSFAVVDAAGHVVNGKREPRLATIRPQVDPGAGELALRFPDGSRVAAPLRYGPSIDARFSGRELAGRLVEGPWADAISAWVDQPLRLVTIDQAGSGPDRGPTVTLLSVDALRSLADAGGSGVPLDHRRFRMTFGLRGIDAFAEDAWVGRRVRVGGATIEVTGNVGRCAVTTRDPDTGESTFDTLRVLQETRGEVWTTERLPCGVWARVVDPGAISLGDPVEPVEA
jgi:uncharacterized protein YcbX